MRILFLGDIVGKTGRALIQRYVMPLRQEWQLDLVIVNGENATNGFGISPEHADEIFHCGVDVITSGNHAFDKTEILDYYRTEKKILRPLNYPSHVVGGGSYQGKTKNGKNFLVVNVMGQLFMQPISDPFLAVTQVLTDGNPKKQGFDAIIVDIHAEATSEKMAFGHFLDGRVSLVVGTHTHIPTADTRILEKGTGYQTDAGMCGSYDSIIGMEKTTGIKRFLKEFPFARLEPARGPASLAGVFLETNEMGLAKFICPIRLDGDLMPQKPDL